MFAVSAANSPSSEWKRDLALRIAVSAIEDVEFLTVHEMIWDVDAPEALNARDDDEIAEEIFALVQGCRVVLPDE